MDIGGISAYLKKFQVLLGDKKEEKKVIQDVIQEFCRFEIPFEHILIRNFVVFFDVSPLQKTEIVLQKKLILKTLSEKQILLTDLR